MKHKGSLVKLCVALVVFSSSILGDSKIIAQGSENAANRDSVMRFEENDSPSSLFDPENPSEVVRVIGKINATKGPLRLDLVPIFNFGPQAISSEDRLYFAKAQDFLGKTPVRANYAQVTDNRGSIAGWELSVRQEGQFINENTANSELKGAVISLDKQWANSTMPSKHGPIIVKDAITIDEMGATYPIATAKSGKGNGIWLISFGSSGTLEGVESTIEPMLDVEGNPLMNSTIGNKPIFKNKAISLFVPGKTKKDPVKYTTVLTWTISELP